MAIAAPTGARARAASGRATRYGTPADCRCESVVAPNTTNTAWASDSWRERPMSRLRLAKTRTKATAVVRVRSLDPLRNGGRAAATLTTTTTGMVGNRKRRGRGRRERGATWLAVASRKLPAREKTRTPNSITNGRALGRPLRAVLPVSATILVARLCRTPNPKAARAVRGKLR